MQSLHHLCYILGMEFSKRKRKDKKVCLDVTTFPCSFNLKGGHGIRWLADWRIVGLKRKRISVKFWERKWWMNLGIWRYSESNRLYIIHISRTQFSPLQAIKISGLKTLNETSLVLILFSNYFTDEVMFMEMIWYEEYLLTALSLFNFVLPPLYLYLTNHPPKLLKLLM